MGVLATSGIAIKPYFYRVGLSPESGIIPGFVN